MHLSIIVLILIFSSNLSGVVFSKQATKEPQLIQTYAKQWCPITGLNIKNNYKVSYIANLAVNGNPRQYVSLYSLVKDMEDFGLEEQSIKVIDVTSEKYIDVNSAFFVIGSRVHGTNSKLSKLAFTEKKDANNFIKRYGGKIVEFNEVLQSAKESFKKDEKHFLNLKKKKSYFRGKNISARVCSLDELDLEEYLEINELKEALISNKLCKPLSENNLHDLALYLWEVKRFGTLESVISKIEVTEDEKCPVCGMFTYKYPRWAAQIFYEENGKKTHYSFDGVKDLMKFYFNSSKWGNYPLAKKKNIKKLLVTDYYTQKGIDGFKAYYVIRSDIYGPMGHEFIPFESKEDAKVFIKEHFGKKILEFREITEDQTYLLDSSE